MVIRAAGLDDRENICLLSDVINRDHFEHMPGDFRRPDGAGGDWTHWLAFIEDERGVLLVAEDNGGLSGFVAARVIDSGKSAYLVPKKKLQIATIVVADEARRRGFGRALIESAIQAGRDLGATDVFLEVMAYNAGAQKFYESLGFADFSRKLAMPVSV